MCRISAVVLFAFVVLSESKELAEKHGTNVQYLGKSKLVNKLAEKMVTVKKVANALNGWSPDSTKLDDATLGKAGSQEAFRDKVYISHFGAINLPKNPAQASSARQPSLPSSKQIKEAAKRVAIAGAAVASVSMGAAESAAKMTAAAHVASSIMRNANKQAYGVG